MRLRSFILGVFWLAVLGYAGYAAITASSSYFQTRALVEQAFVEVSQRPRASGVTEAGIQEVAADLRSAILFGARRSGIPMDPRHLEVSPERGGVRVRFRWSVPILTYGGETVVAIPLWLERSFDIRPASR